MKLALGIAALVVLLPFGISADNVEPRSAGTGPRIAPGLEVDAASIRHRASGRPTKWANGQPGQSADVLGRPTSEAEGRDTKRVILGASIGFAAGATLGYLGQRLACGFDEDDDCRVSAPMVIGFGVAGMVPGAIIGAVLGSDRGPLQAAFVRTSVVRSGSRWMLTRLFAF